MFAEITIDDVPVEEVRLVQPPPSEAPALILTVSGSPAPAPRALHQRPQSSGASAAAPCGTGCASAR